MVAEKLKNIGKYLFMPISKTCVNESEYRYLRSHLRKFKVVQSYLPRVRPIYNVNQSQNALRIQKFRQKS